MFAFSLTTISRRWMPKRNSTHGSICIHSSSFGPEWVSTRFLSTDTSRASIELDDEKNRNSPAEVRSSNPSRFWAHSSITGRAQRPIFVAATRQHVGKTTTCLALLSGLQKRYNKVGFLKPVGQQHVQVTDKNQNELRVDKDVVLIKEHFHLDHIDYRYMSPVIIPRGYTRAYVDGEITLESQKQDVESAMEHIAAESDITLIEGTGHCAVGSIVGLNNAKVASLLGADMVLIANGGLGKAFDELELNRILCQHYGVRIAGVIINKVIPEKYEQTKHYMAKAMMQAWGVPLLGCIPDRPFLGCPALADLETLFDSQLVSGQQHRFRHYNTHDINVVTTSLTRFLENLRAKPSRTLYICHVTRDDLIVGFMGEYQRRRRQSEQPFEAALLVCGRKGKYLLSPEVSEMMEGVENAPIMMVNGTTHEAMRKIHDYTPKLNIHDTNRVGVAVDHYEPYIDFDELLRRTTSSNSSFNEPGSISFDDLRRL
ncbi:cobyrinic acid a,c-diamide synthase [Nitzschia inconspicua]|uniref:Cobyrinic acid a,c-diamide synthase n=1 Tax=Nitzschia inconspicua TaxID=303405 RepID=A0A9K3PYL3_9STRA|nr:cobyrinic acid a,c-diamide synthase [Nitzschia inconspicua]